MNERTKEMIQDMSKQIEEQLISVETQIQEFHRMLQDIDEYVKIEEGEEVLAPISNGIFVKARSTASKDFLINVGGNTIVEKTPEETKEMIQGQIKELEKYRDELIQKFENANGMYGA